MVNSQTTKIQAVLWKGLFICALGACFYLYEFILQVAPGIITNELMRDLKIDAVGLGLISSAYFFSYMPMQLPAGVLYDRYGPRILLSLMTMVCAGGTLFFSLTDTVLLAAAGRALTGVGSAFAFIGTLVLVSRWLPPSMFAVSTGVVQLMSSVGAIIGGMPLAMAVTAYGWRASFLSLSIMGFILAILLWLIVRDNPPGDSSPKEHHYQGEWARLKFVCGNAQTWLIAGYAFALWAPVIVFAELWGIPFLSAYYHMEIESASGAIAMVWLGIGIGSPLIGYLSDYIESRRIPLLYAAATGFVVSLLVIFCPMPFRLLQVMLFIFGGVAGGSILTFSLAKENNKISNVGTAIGLNNMMVVAGGAVFHPLVGYILRYTWSGQMQEDIPVYTAQNYQVGMLIIPVCYMIGGLLSWFFIKENHCKQSR